MRSKDLFLVGIILVVLVFIFILGCFIFNQRPPIPSHKTGDPHIPGELIASDYYSINAAIAALPASGGVVYIPPGIRQESVIISKANVTLWGDGIGSTIIQKTTAITYDYSISIRANNSTIRDLTVDGNSKVLSQAGAKSNIEAEGSGTYGPITFINVETYQSAYNGFLFGFMNNSVNITLINCTSHDNAMDGIAANNGAPNVHVINSSVFNNGQFGVSFIWSAGKTVDNCSVVNSTVANNAFYGIYFTQSLNPIITGNTVYGNQHGIVIDNGANNALILNNTLRDNTDTDMYLGESIETVNGTVAYNSCNSTSAKQIFLNDNINTTTVHDNVVTGGGGIGISVHGASAGNNIYNNVVANSTVAGISCDDSSYPWGRNSYNQIHDNVLINDTTGIDLYGIYHHIYNNTITGNTVGIGLTRSNATLINTDSAIYNNTITGNKIGFNVTAANNTIYGNMINNTQNNAVLNGVWPNMWNSTTITTVNYHGYLLTGYMGNYWSDLPLNRSYRNKTVYYLDDSNIDQHPINSLL